MVHGTICDIALNEITADTHLLDWIGLNSALFCQQFAVTASRQDLIDGTVAETIQNRASKYLHFIH